MSFAGRAQIYYQNAPKVTRTLGDVEILISLLGLRVLHYQIQYLLARTALLELSSARHRYLLQTDLRLLLHEIGVKILANSA